MTGLNVRVRLLRTRVLPGVPVLATPITIWWRERRFHVRDEAGRSFAEITADVTEPRGFGLTPRTMEEFMDAAAPPLDRGPTDLYGDLDAPTGVVHEPLNRRWAVPLGKIAGVAELVLAGDLDGLAPTGRETLLGRDCAEYRTSIEGAEDGRPFRSDVRRLVAGPYALLREVVDAGGLMRLRVEAVALDEGAVMESDVEGC